MLVIVNINQIDNNKNNKNSNNKMFIDSKQRVVQNKKQQNKPQLSQDISQQLQNNLQLQHFNLNLNPNYNPNIILNPNLNFSSNISTVNAGVKGCTCKKSKCMKMYCDCYLSGIRCTQNCKCLNCENAVLYDHQGNRLEDFQQNQNFNINLNASLYANSNMNMSVDQIRKIKNQNKGCNCKKSECLKKYCQCFNSGVVCHSLCKCEECKNTVNGDTEQHMHSQSLGMDQLQSLSLSNKIRDKQMNQKIMKLINQVNQEYRESMLQFLCYLLS